MHPKPALRFESDLQKPRNEVYIYNSFEWWWLRKELIQVYGERCMNCNMQKKEGVYIEINQIIPQRNTYDDLFDISNHQILCRRCNENKPYTKNSDFRPLDWREKLETIQPIKLYDSHGFNLPHENTEELARELKSNRIFVNLTSNELKKEVKRAFYIST